MARCSVEFPSSVGADGVAKRLALPFQARGPRRCEPAVPKESSLANPQPPRSTPTWSNMRISTAHSRASVSAYRCWRMASSLPMCCRARSWTDTPTKLGPRNESGHWAGSCPSSPRPLPLHHPRNQSRFSVKASRRARHAAALRLGTPPFSRAPLEDPGPHRVAHRSWWLRTLSWSCRWGLSTTCVSRLSTVELVVPPSSLPRCPHLWHTIVLGGKSRRGCGGGGWIAFRRRRSSTESSSFGSR